MTEAEARALVVGSPVGDGGSGVGVVIEKGLEWLAVRWSAPPTRVEGCSVVDYDNMRRWSGTAPMSGVNLLGNVTPPTIDSGDTDPYTLGMVFRTSQAGNAIGARFYKAAANGGLHTGNLWSAAGAKLAEKAFAGETASGWQQQLFDAPVPLTINTDYVISVTMPQGHYSAQVNFFASPLIVGPLTGRLSSDVPPGNGRFVQLFAPNQEVPVFPNQSVSSANYWVDVIFAAA